MKLHLKATCFIIYFVIIEGGACSQNETSSEIIDRIVSNWNNSPEGKSSWMKRIWNSLSRVNPCHKSKDVFFYLYQNPMAPGEYLEISTDTVDSENVVWNFGSPLKVLIHGFQESRHTLMPQLVKDAYLEVQRESTASYNILIVDWGCFSQDAEFNVIPLYSKALDGISIAASKTTEIILKIMSLKKPPVETLDSIHIIGHCLGSLVARLVGYQLQITMKKRVGRITGLDPVVVTNSYLYPSHRSLQRTDAENVDIINTAWGSFPVGPTEGMGSVLFYPKDDINEMKKHLIPHCTDVFKMVGLDSCSHRLTPIYFSLSILKSDLKACGCEGTTEADFTTDKIEICMNKCEHRIKFGEAWNHNSSDLMVNFVDIPHGNVKLRQSPTSEVDSKRISSVNPFSDVAWTLSVQILYSFISTSYHSN